MKIIMVFIENEDYTGYIKNVQIDDETVTEFNGEYIDLSPLIPYIGKQIEIHKYIENAPEPKISIHTISDIREKEYSDRIGLELFFD